MTGTLTIAKARPAEIGLDQPQLYALGLDHVRKLARRVWTDHNVHDPGITTLELLSYALTDLTYRASLPIEDLLEGSSDFVPLSAARILPNQPLTILDYRKLMIDVEGVKNAWLEPIELPYSADAKTGEISLKKLKGPGIREIRLGGVYQVRIEYEDTKLSNPKKLQLRNEVLRRLHQHRNLCEDFEGVKTVEPQSFLLCGELDLLPDANTSAVHIEILRRVQDYLAPGVTRYTRDEMLERRKADGSLNTPADLFEGPLLEHGFIDDEELRAADLRKEIRLSDIISIVMDVPGVRAVRDMLIGPEPQAGDLTPIPNRWLVQVDPGKQATLNTAKSRLVYYKRNIPVIPAAVEALPVAAAPAITCEDVAIPNGRKRNLSSYTSFQEHFPAVYGVGGHPLPDTAPERRRALAAQLKAYLLFFDQVMANYCEQLARVSELFAVAKADTATYFAQAVSQTPEYLQIYGTNEAGVAALESRLDAGVETSGERQRRRTRFLDHLIARFAEQFHEYAQIMRSAFGASDASLLADRRDFLEAYPVIGRDRGLAFDYTLKDPLWDTSDNISGLEKRIARLLGIGDPRRRNLTDVTPGPDTNVASAAAAQFGYTLTDRDAPAGKTLLRENATSATADLARAQMLRAFELGQWESTYRRTETAGHKWFFTIVEKDGTVVGRGAEVATAAELEAAIVELRSYLRRYYSREGLYVIENLLLRPENTTDPALHFCVDPGCTECAGDDPYSWRIHVILPAFAGRFNDMDFRRFVEETIREEVPAHILPKICWIGEEDMRKVQKAYRDWLEVRAGGAAAERAARIGALVDVLTTVKSVYPVQKLIACDAVDGKEKFILGRTALGTKDHND